MNDLQAKSLDANLTTFVKPLSDKKLVELTNFLVYRYATDQPEKWVLDFVHEFVGEKDWNDVLSDEIKKPEYFNKASRNAHELVRVIRIWLLEESFRRFQLSLVKPKNILEPKDKASLIEILDEHKAMLEYQLEDEDAIRSVGEDGEELVQEKKKHLKFLENVAWWKKL
jgi:hypothetical protein